QVYRMIEIIGDAPVIDGWRFRGVIDWSAGDMPLCHGTTDVEIYRNAEKRCDHCNTRRLKTLGIVIRKEDQTMLVGRECARDFLGQRDIEQAELINIHILP